MLICFIDTKKREKLIKEFSLYLYSFFSKYKEVKLFKSQKLVKTDNGFSQTYRDPYPANEKG